MFCCCIFFEPFLSLLSFDLLVVPPGRSAMCADGAFPTDKLKFIYLSIYLLNRSLVSKCRARLIRDPPPFGHMHIHWKSGNEAIMAEQISDGLKKEVLKPGSGDRPNRGDAITVQCNRGERSYPTCTTSGRPINAGNVSAAEQRVCTCNSHTSAEPKYLYHTRVCHCECGMGRLICSDAVTRHRRTA